MLAPQRARYALFDNVNVKWFWSEHELVQFRKMWNEGQHIQEIAKAFKTNKRSIALTVIDQAEQDKIKQRNKGLYGS